MRVSRGETKGDSVGHHTFSRVMQCRMRIYQKTKEKKDEKM